MTRDEVNGLAHELAAECVKRCPNRARVAVLVFDIETGRASLETNMSVPAVSALVDMCLTRGRDVVASKLVVE